MPARASSPEPGARRKRRWARAGRVAAASVAASYLLLLAFPDVLFAYHATRGNFRVSSEVPLDPRLAAVLDDAEARLARSPLNDPRMVHRLYVCDSPLRRWLLTPGGRGSFGTTYAVIRTTVLERVDVRDNLSYRDAPRDNVRPLGSVIAHERMHALLDRRFGALACFRMPTWKTEGYCEFVAGDPSFDVAEGKRLICDGKDDDSGPFRYFRYHAMVKYLLEVEGLSVDELFSRRFDEAALLAKVRGSIDRLRF
jgi:hypothetical protein